MLATILKYVNTMDHDPTSSMRAMSEPRRERFAAPGVFGEQADASTKVRLREDGSMMRHAAGVGVLLVVGAVLVSCAAPAGQTPQPAGGAGGFSSLPTGCYVTKIDPTTVNATITFYGWPDNSPPGNAIAHPVLHQVASGDGTYCNPTTFATEKKNDSQIPYGIKIYVPFLEQYFIREDDCAHSGPHRGHGHNGCSGLWFDLWIGGDKASLPHAVFWCEDHLTPNGKVQVILNPDDGLSVENAGPIYLDDPVPKGTCFGTPEKN